LLRVHSSIYIYIYMLRPPQWTYELRAVSAAPTLTILKFVLNLKYFEIEAIACYIVSGSK